MNAKSGYAAMRNFLETYGRPPEAMFIASDSIAPGAMMALRERGCGCPRISASSPLITPYCRSILILLSLLLNCSCVKMFGLLPSVCSFSGRGMSGASELWFLANWCPEEVLPLPQLIVRHLNYNPNELGIRRSVTISNTLRRSSQGRGCPTGR